jgi:hypothetical protein
MHIRICLPTFYVQKTDATPLTQFDTNRSINVAGYQLLSDKKTIKFSDLRLVAGKFNFMG